MSKTKSYREPVILEVQVDRLNEKGVFVAMQILNVLYDVLEKRSIFRPWRNASKRRGSFGFEIVHLGGRIRFFLICEKQYQSFVANQFYAQFPNIDITPVDDHLAGDEKLVYAQMRLKNYTHASLKLYTEFKEKNERDPAVDPFSAITSALVKGQKNMEVFQVTFMPLYDGEWKSEKLV